MGWLMKYGCLGYDKPLVLLLWIYYATSYMVMASPNNSRSPECTNISAVDHTPWTLYCRRPDQPELLTPVIDIVSESFFDLISLHSGLGNLELGLFRRPNMGSLNTYTNLISLEMNTIHGITMIKKLLNLIDTNQAFASHDGITIGKVGDGPVFDDSLIAIMVYLEHDLPMAETLIQSLTNDQSSDFKVSIKTKRLEMVLGLDLDSSFRVGSLRASKTGKKDSWLVVARNLRHKNGWQTLFKVSDGHDLTILGILSTACQILIHREGTTVSSIENECSECLSNGITMEYITRLLYFNLFQAKFDIQAILFYPNTDYRQAGPNTLFSFSVFTNEHSARQINLLLLEQRACCSWIALIGRVSAYGGLQSDTQFKVNELFTADRKREKFASDIRSHLDKYTTALLKGNQIELDNPYALSSPLDMYETFGCMSNNHLVSYLPKNPENTMKGLSYKFNFFLPNREFDLERLLVEHEWLFNFDLPFRKYFKSISIRLTPFSEYNLGKVVQVTWNLFNLTKEMKIITGLCFKLMSIIVGFEKWELDYGGIVNTKNFSWIEGPNDEHSELFHPFELPLFKTKAKNSNGKKANLPKSHASNWVLAVNSVEDTFRSIISLDALLLFENLLFPPLSTRSNNYDGMTFMICNENGSVREDSSLSSLSYGRYTTITIKGSSVTRAFLIDLMKKMVASSLKYVEKIFLEQNSELFNVTILANDVDAFLADNAIAFKYEVLPIDPKLANAAVASSGKARSRPKIYVEHEGTYIELFHTKSYDIVTCAEYYIHLLPIVDLRDKEIIWSTAPLKKLQNKPMVAQKFELNQSNTSNLLSFLVDVYLFEKCSFEGCSEWAEIAISCSRQRVLVYFEKQFFKRHFGQIERLSNHKLDTAMFFHNHMKLYIPTNKLDGKSNETLSPSPIKNPPQKTLIDLSKEKFANQPTVPSTSSQQPLEMQTEPVLGTMFCIFPFNDDETMARINSFLQLYILEDSRKSSNTVLNSMFKFKYTPYLQTIDFHSNPDWTAEIKIDLKLEDGKNTLNCSDFESFILLMISLCGIDSIPNLQLGGACSHSKYQNPNTSIGFPFTKYAQVSGLLQLPYGPASSLEQPKVDWKRRINEVFPSLEPHDNSNGCKKSGGNKHVKKPETTGFPNEQSVNTNMVNAEDKSLTSHRYLSQIIPLFNKVRDSSTPMLFESTWSLYTANHILWTSRDSFLLQLRGQSIIWNDKMMKQFFTLLNQDGTFPPSLLFLLSTETSLLTIGSAYRTSHRYIVWTIVDNNTSKNSVRTTDELINQWKNVVLLIQLLSRNPELDGDQELLPFKRASNCVVGIEAVSGEAVNNWKIDVIVDRIKFEQLESNTTYLWIPKVLTELNKLGNQAY